MGDDPVAIIRAKIMRVRLISLPCVLSWSLVSACGQPDDPATAADTSSTQTEVDTDTDTDTGTDTSSGSTSSDEASSDESDTTAGEPKARKSLVVALDGVRPDAMATANTPTLDALADGSWAPGYGGAHTGKARTLTDADTVSGPNHWSIMTGAIGAQHGVSSNGEVPLGDAEAFPHYLSLLESAAPSLGTAYLFTWGLDLAIPCTADYVKHGTDPTNTERVVALLNGSFEDDAGSANSAWTRGAPVDAIFLFLDDTDGTGHRFGFSPEVPEYLAAIEAADAQLGSILDAVKARPSFDQEAWQVVVTTDHGGEGTDHGGNCEACEAIFFLVSSPEVASPLPDYDPDTQSGPRNFDAAPTALTHMGVDLPEYITGSSWHLGG